MYILTITMQDYQKTNYVTKSKVIKNLFSPVCCLGLPALGSRSQMDSIATKYQNKMSFSMFFYL